MKKRILAFISASVTLLCAPASVVQAQEETFTVGICQFIRHEALDSATRGFQSALTEEFGDRVSFEVKNAQGEYSACATVVNGLIADHMDLILANATAALQAAVTATSEIPILGTSVTEYGAALQIEDFDGIVGGNVSGTSDLAPLEEQAAMIKELFPDAEKVGLLYSSAEPNSQYQIEVVEETLVSMGYSCGIYTFSDSNDISAVTRKAASECEVLYVPTDNSVASNAELIANICIPDKVPVIAGEENTCRLCGAATLSINYYDLGYQTGKMAAQILTGQEEISSMPIAYADTFTKRYNKEICEKLGLAIPDDYEPLPEE